MKSLSTFVLRRKSEEHMRELQEQLDAQYYCSDCGADGPLLREEDGPDSIVVCEQCGQDARSDLFATAGITATKEVA
jgi:transcription elongation factor Elf1